MRPASVGSGQPILIQVGARDRRGSPYGRRTRLHSGIVAEQTGGYRVAPPPSPATPAPAIAPTLSAAVVPTTSTKATPLAAVDVVVTAVTDPFRFAGVDAPSLRARLTLLRRLEGATTAGIATTLAALDRAGGVQGDGAPSKTEWLKAHTGRNGRDAARMARLADNLDHLPATAQALVDGRVGSDAADTIVKATRDGRLGDPSQVESDLLDIADTTTPEELRREVRRRQQAADGAALLRNERRQHAMRDLSLVRDGDTGMWNLRGRISDECGTRLRTTLDAFDHADPTDTLLLQRRRPGQRLADALDQLATAALDHTLAPTSSGIARPHLSVIVDLPTVAADLSAHDPDGEGLDTHGPHGGLGSAIPPDDPRWADLPAGKTAWGGTLSPQAVRRIVCDVSMCRIVMTAGSQILDVGRATREWSEPQRRAINARDGGCRGPSCTRPIAWTQIHHVHWWSNDGPTAVDNGIALCHHCHRLVHDNGWTLLFDPETSSATWRSPDGRTTHTTPDRRHPPGDTENDHDLAPTAPPRGAAHPCPLVWARPPTTHPSSRLEPRWDVTLSVMGDMQPSAPCPVDNQTLQQRPTQQAHATPSATANFDRRPRWPHPQRDLGPSANYHCLADHPSRRATIARCRSLAAAPPHDPCPNRGVRTCQRPPSVSLWFGGSHWS